MSNSKVNRTLKIYDMLQKGEIISKDSLAEEFNVDERSIRRDISDINKYLKLQNDDRFVLKIKGCDYVLEDEKIESFDKSVFLISKILLNSRAFNKEEKDLILESFIEKVSIRNKKLIKKLISNERYNYFEVEHKSKLINKIWELTEYIDKQEIIFIKYKKNNGNIIKDKFSPFGIVFSEFYFYMIGKYKDSDTNAVLRVDRVIDFEGTDEKYKVNYSTRVQESELKKKMQFMYSGIKKRIKFLFKGEDIESVKDRLPGARIKDNGSNTYLVDVEVFGDGIIMWFLSQGRKITVIEPEEMVLKIKDEVNKMKENYN
ncbi:WYL domain-containing transcriptional regulator [Clostridium sp. Ade.TY]|uniref:helix-turn-helix transcriptional regulator n=1 Tax=Clostridium sp. Ade.TY TaxID=1391647 RepID=UPI00042174A0|nr:WYL domain-containing transcriptional regulator [Clostridium sp. Ade.TY]